MFEVIFEPRAFAKLPAPIEVDKDQLAEGRAKKRIIRSGEVAPEKPPHVFERQGLPLAGKLLGEFVEPRAIRRRCLPVRTGCHASGLFQSSKSPASCPAKATCVSLRHTALANKCGADGFTRRYDERAGARIVDL